VARWRDDEEPVPERLARFVAGEWPAPDPAGAWGAAARGWLAAHPGRELPLAADTLEVRQWVVALRASLAEARAWHEAHPSRVDGGPP
jgi:hypothetical protein